MHTGVLILKGDNDLSDVWRNMIEEVPASLAIGNSKRLESNAFLDVSSDTEIGEVLLTIHRQLPPEPYSYIVWSDEPNNLTRIPNRGSTIAKWMDGGRVFGADELDPIKLLTRLNSSAAGDEPQEQFGNYTNLVKERVVKKIKAPKWAMTLLYAGISKPSFILSTKKMMMYMWLMVINNSYLLVWSTQENLVNSMVSKLERVQQHQVFYLPIEFGDNSLVTIHPLYLISKINTNMRKHLDPGTKRLLSCTYIRNYLMSMMVPVQYERDEV